MKWDVPEHTTIKKTKSGKKVNTQHEPATTGDVISCANRILQMIDRFEKADQAFTKDDARLLQAWLKATGHMVEHVGHSKKTAFRRNQGINRASIACDKLNEAFKALNGISKW